ncbi:RND family efflux transporter, MFP subunit [Pseudidiomarina planktonica]|uniref:RND family efflux transporter, MFP subunit n=1 Tax=Pseudidiomarina planktonica TaxID=1323738 RepID=A0A1Y6F155_9GAMM|nr:efflux RND transporter periplasmic adaptor subunit [Pseudidiomarina planktonica]RUO65167.1 efflux RND transporter periplasmic adaptor subunit [Pseudidiomarina planktonica]SMQ66203.1 RND family efflux transporter, MFP subunit [Pseudidiomarina planktonica]
MNTRTLLAWSFLISSTALLSGCNPAGANDSETAEAAAPEARVPVATTVAEQASITSSYRTTAVLEAREEADVTSKVNGIVEEILVEEGDYVEKGQVLAVLRDNEYAIQAAQTQAELQSIQQELKRMKNMADREMISADAYDKLRYQVQIVQSKHDMAQLNLSETRIVAPINGHIAVRYVKTGNMVQQYQAKTLFHIVDQNRLQGIVHLPEHELRHLQVGQTAALSVSAYPQQEYTARVERISPVIDTASGTFKVVLEVNNSENQLKSGMFAQLNLHYAKRDNVVVLPRYAVISLDGSHHVFVVNNEGVAAKQTVLLGFETDENVEITKGLNAGDEVITTGQNSLKDQALVEVIKPATSVDTATALEGNAP